MNVKLSGAEKVALSRLKHVNPSIEDWEVLFRANIPYFCKKIDAMKDFLIDKVEEISFERVDVEDSLWNAGVLDSITIVELAVEIENEFSIEIPFDEIVEDNFETVSNIMKYIERKQA